MPQEEEGSEKRYCVFCLALITFRDEQGFIRNLKNHYNHCSSFPVQKLQKENDTLRSELQSLTKKVIQMENNERRRSRAARGRF